MENVSRFTSFTGKTVASGSKVSGSAFPTLMITSTKDKFVLNNKALALMAIATGSYVVLIDMNRGEVTTTDPNARFFITKGWEKPNGAFEGAKIGAGGSFSYAGVYSAMQMNKPDITEATIKDMVDADLGITREGKDSGKENFIATQKVSYKVERVTNVIKDEEGNEVTVSEFEVAPGVVQQVYALVERTEIEHNPSEIDDDASADATTQDATGNGVDED
jgi:hypothetical protein